MARRVYYLSERKKKLREDALAMMRRTRECIDPALLATAREAIAQAAYNIRRQEEESYSEITGGKVPVDRRKVLNVIMKYIEINPESAGVQEELQAYLNESGPS